MDTLTFEVVARQDPTRLMVNSRIAYPHREPRHAGCALDWEQGGRWDYHTGWELTDMHLDAACSFTCSMYPEAK